jgi:hypothetical protein
MLRKLVTFFSVLMVIASGCGTKAPKTIQITPGKKNLAESISALQSCAAKVVPVQIRGRCLWEHKSPTEKNKKEEFSVRIWITPPDLIRLQGDVAFDPKGLLLGSNSGQFWLAIKPQVSTFWWGKWTQQADDQQLIISPKRILEAIGLVQIENQTMWSLSNKDGFDILTKRNAGGKLLKKIYLSGSEYRVARIEYFDTNEKNVITLELEKYRKATDSFFIPGIIRTISYNSDSSIDSFRISIKSVKEKQFSGRQKNAIFSFPASAGYEKVYQIIDGTAVEIRR